MAIGELRWRKIDEPPPAPVKRGPKMDRRRNLFAVLDMMQVNESIEVELSRRTCDNYVYQFRVDTNRELQFKVRMSDRLGWSKIWRVA